MKKPARGGLGLIGADGLEDRPKVRAIELANTLRQIVCSNDLTSKSLDQKTGLTLGIPLFSCGRRLIEAEGG